MSIAQLDKDLHLNVWIHKDENNNKNNYNDRYQAFSVSALDTMWHMAMSFLTLCGLIDSINIIIYFEYLLLNLLLLSFLMFSFYGMD